MLKKFVSDIKNKIVECSTECSAVNDLKKAELLISVNSAKDKGLFAGQKVIVGKTNNGKYIGLGGQTSAYLVSPITSPVNEDKQIDSLLPIALSYSHSMIICDKNQQIWSISSSFRARCGHKVYLFDPFNPKGKTHRWNPLSYVHREPEQRVDDLNQIAICLIPDTGGNDSFFEESARQLFIGLGLYCLDREAFERNMAISQNKPTSDIFIPTIKAILDYATNFDGEAISYFNALMNDFFISQVAKQSINSAVSAGDKTFASILATLTANLTPWLSESVSNATSGDDFDLRRVRKELMSIYFNINTKDIIVGNQYQNLFNLFFTQLISLNTKGQEDLPLSPLLPYKYQCLMVIDETVFDSLGEEDKSKNRLNRLNSLLRRALPHIHDFNLRILLVSQSPAQLINSNFDTEQFRNFALKVFFTPNTDKDSEDYAELLGKSDLKPQDLRSMSKNKEILAFEGFKSIHSPICANRLNDRKDPIFLSRISSPPFFIAPNELSEVVADLKEEDGCKRFKWQKWLN